MDLDALGRLRTEAGSDVLAAAADLLSGPGDRDRLAASAELRRRGVDADLTAAALTQAVLRARARAKFGADAARMFFTRTGLEQATRAVVANRRAARVAASGVRRIADLGCGIGADTLAFARAGLDVVAIDLDPTTAGVAWANAAALGVADRITVECADATTADLAGVDAAFCDPARRGAAAGRRLFDPTGHSPPWSFVAALAQRMPRTVLKLSPGIDHAVLPVGAEAEWVSVDGDVVEATVWCGPFAGPARRATVLRDGRPAELVGTGVVAAPVEGVRRYLFDPDGAVVRAHLVAEFAAAVDGALADPLIAYVFADRPATTAFGRCFEVIDTLPFGRKPLRAALHTRGIGRLEIRKRGLALEPDRLRRELRLRGDVSATLVLTRLRDRPTALLCRPVA